MMRSWMTVVVMLAGPLHATTVPAMTPAELRAAADVVVEGDVAGSESRRVGRRIFTFVTVVSRRPDGVTTTLVAIPGGVVGGVAQVVPGAPLLEPGVRYRLFLGPANGPALDDGDVAARGVIGFWRGVFVLDHLGRATPLLPDGRTPVSPIGPVLPAPPAPGQP